MFLNVVTFCPRRLVVFDSFVEYKGLQLHYASVTDASIPVVVPIIISIVMVPMMVTVPAVPPIFIRVTIMAVAVSVVIVRSVLLVSGVNVNAEPIVCFGIGRC